MPKRKRDEYEHISDQLKRLKKKLKRVRKHLPSSSDTDSNNEENDPLGIVIDDREESNTVSQEPIQIEIASESQKSVEALTAEDVDTNLDKDLLEILGDDPSIIKQHGPEIHKELASRLQHITSFGLTKETRKDLQQRYLIPSNSILIGAPLMNPEIRAALPETLATRDRALESKQKFLASAISCVASATSDLLGSIDKNTELLKKLMDANRILCDIQHSDSVTRRMFSTSALKKEVKTQILNSKIDRFLFGENLPEALKTAKAVSKSSVEIKNINRNKKPQPSTSKPNNLNAKAPAAPTRKPPATTYKSRHTTHQSQPARSSKTSSQPQRSGPHRR